MISQSGAYDRRDIQMPPFGEQGIWETFAPRLIKSALSPALVNKEAQSCVSPQISLPPLHL